MKKEKVFLHVLIGGKGKMNEQKDVSPYKNKNRRLVTQPYDMSVATVVSQIIQGDIILGPEYQRAYRWDGIKASRFIESLLLNIPIPTIFLAEEEDVTYSVIDGRQRLSTIRNFIQPENEEERLILEGLQVREDLNGSSFEQLDLSDQGKLKKQYLRAIVILNESDPQIKFDVFERLNTGSAKLSEQEIRNCIYRGNFNAMLKKLAQNKTYLKLLGLPNSKSKDMTAEEYILRFFAYKEDLKNYSGSVKEFLNEFMKTNKNISQEKIYEFESTFKEAVKLIDMVLGENAFKRYLNKDKEWHHSLNNAIFDAEMVAFSNVNIKQKEKHIVEEKIIELMQKPVFIKTVQSSTNAPEKVKNRIKMMEEAISIK